VAEDALLRIYLNDHLAALTVGEELARRAARGRERSGAGAVLEELAAAASRDRAALLAIMTRTRTPVRHYKVLAARAAERVGRLKPNGRALTRSPLSDLIEVEGLRVTLEATAACWRTLRELAERDPRLDAHELDELLHRARSQADTLDGCRSDAAAQAFGPPPP